MGRDRAESVGCEAVRFESFHRRPDTETPRERKGSGMSILRLSKVSITNHRPPPGAGEKSALEHNVRPGAALVRICISCGSEFDCLKSSNRRTCGKACENRERFKNIIKQEYWWKNEAGYIEGNVWIEGKRRRVKQHRWIMEKHIGRKLSRWETVHHIDGDKTNNHIRNLEILDHVQHALLHNAERKISNGWNPRPHQILQVKRRSEERRIRRESL